MLLLTYITLQIMRSQEALERYIGKQCGKSSKIFLGLIKRKKKWSKNISTATTNIDLPSWALPRQLVIMFSVCKLCFHIYRVLVSASYNTIIIVCLLQLLLDWKVYHQLCLVVGQISQGSLYRDSWQGSPSSQRAKTNGKFLFQNVFFFRSWTSSFSPWPLQWSIPM